ncbi:MAG: phosphoribosylanthranilate isomerase, partial [Actinomycetota bacterium]
MARPKMEQTFVKICGITRLDDARAAVRAGANAVGFVFAKSPRRITPAGARRIAERLHPAVRRVGVFVDSPAERILEIVDQVGLDGVQLQGSEPPQMLDEIRRARPNLFLARVVRADRRQTIEGLSDSRADAMF